MPRHTKSSRPKSVISWRFAKQARALSCRVDVAGRTPSFTATGRPHGGVARAIVEPVAGLANRLARDARVVSSLGAAGWRVVSYTY